MDILKRFWPLPFKVKKGDLGSFLIQLILFIIVCAVAGLVIGLLAKIPVIGIIFSIIGSLIGIYGFIGIVVCILRFLGFLK